MITKINRYSVSVYKLNLGIFSYEKILKDRISWNLRVRIKVFGIVVYSSEKDALYREDLEFMV